MTPAFEQIYVSQISDEWAYHRRWTNQRGNNDVLWLCTFHCSLEEDLAATTGENAIVAAWSLIGAHQADFMGPTLSLCWGCGSNPFLSGGRAGRETVDTVQKKVKDIQSLLIRFPVGFLTSSSTTEQFFSKWVSILFVLHALRDARVDTCWHISINCATYSTQKGRKKTDVNNAVVKFFLQKDWWVTLNLNVIWDK